MQQQHPLLSAYYACNEWLSRSRSCDSHTILSYFPHHHQHQLRVVAGNSLIPSYRTPRRNSSSSNDSPCSKMLLCLCAASVNVSSSSGSSSLYRHHSITINQFRLFTRTNAAWTIVIMTAACTHTQHTKSQQSLN